MTILYGTLNWTFGQANNQLIVISGQGLDMAPMQSPPDQQSPDCWPQPYGHPSFNLTVKGSLGS